MELTSDNQQLTEYLKYITQECTYLKLREKKLLYLVEIIQKKKNINVEQIFEHEVKPIETPKFENYIYGTDFNPNEKEDIQNMFSFYSSDSFERLGVYVEPP